MIISQMPGIVNRFAQFFQNGTKHTKITEKFVKKIDKTVDNLDFLYYIIYK